jgi:hypothetical protein
MNLNTTLDTLRRWDDQRPSLPGEHWLALAFGLRMLASRGLVSKALGAALVYRAVSGRDGLSALLGRDMPRVEGRRSTMMDGTVIASAAEPEMPTMGDSVRTAREDLKGDMAMMR